MTEKQDETTKKDIVQIKSGKNDAEQSGFESALFINPINKYDQPEIHFQDFDKSFENMSLGFDSFISGSGRTPKHSDSNLSNFKNCLSNDLLKRIDDGSPIKAHRSIKTGRGEIILQGIEDIEDEPKPQHSLFYNKNSQPKNNLPSHYQQVSSDRQNEIISQYQQYQDFPEQHNIREETPCMPINYSYYNNPMDMANNYTNFQKNIQLNAYAPSYLKKEISPQEQINRKIEHSNSTGDLNNNDDLIYLTNNILNRENVDQRNFIRRGNGLNNGNFNEIYNNNSHNLNNNNLNNLQNYRVNMNENYYMDNNQQNFNNHNNKFNINQENKQKVNEDVALNMRSFGNTPSNNLNNIKMNLNNYGNNMQNIRQVGLFNQVGQSGRGFVNNSLPVNEGVNFQQTNINRILNNNNNNNNGGNNNNQNLNQNTDSNIMSGPIGKSYMYGKTGWVCCLCKNFNYESKFIKQIFILFLVRVKCNRCGKAQNRATDDILSQSPSQTPNISNNLQNKNIQTEFNNLNNNNSPLASIIPNSYTIVNEGNSHSIINRLATNSVNNNLSVNNLNNSSPNETINNNNNNFDSNVSTGNSTYPNTPDVDVNTVPILNNEKLIEKTSDFNAEERNNTNQNPIVATTCESKKKKKPFVERVGDWVCIKCKNLNFSFRLVCNRCQLTKTESEKLFEQYMKNLMNYVKLNEMLQNQNPINPNKIGSPENIPAQSTPFYNKMNIHNLNNLTNLKNLTNFNQGSANCNSNIIYNTNQDCFTDESTSEKCGNNSNL